MKRLWLLVLLLAPTPVLCQAATRECMAFGPRNATSVLAGDLTSDDNLAWALEAPVTLSGDYDFYPAPHDGCWTVHVVAMSMPSRIGGSLGYAVSYSVTNPHGVMRLLGLQVGPDQDVFDRAMRAAAVAAVKDIRQMRTGEKPHD